MAKTYDIKMPDGTIKTGVSVDEATALSNQGGSISKVNNPTEQAVRSTPSIPTPSKQYVNPATGAVTTTSKGAPAGTVEYNPASGTSLSAIQQDIGYTDRLADLRAEDERMQLSENAKTAAKMGFSGDQILDFTKGTSSPDTTTPSLPPISSTTAGKTNTGAPAVDVPNVSDAEQLKKDLLRIQEENQLADLSRSAGLARKGVNESAAEIDPRFKGLRSQASVSTQLGQKRLKDLFAATGIAAGTAAAQQISGEQELQSTLGGLATEKAQQEADIQTQLSDIDSETAFLEEQIRRGTTAEETQLAIDALAAREAQDQQSFFDTIGSIQDYQAEINRINAAVATGDTSEAYKIPYLQQERQNKLQTGTIDPITGRFVENQATITLTPSQALSLWSTTGRASQEIADALGSGVNVNDSYSTYAQRTSGGSSGGSGTTATVTPAQTTAYNQMLQNYIGIGTPWATDLNGLANTIRNDKTLLPMLGETLYYQFLNDVQSYINKNYEEPTPEPDTTPGVSDYKFDPDWAYNMQLVETTVDPQTLLNQLTNGAQQYILDYGPQGYNVLVDRLRERIEAQQ